MRWRQNAEKAKREAVAEAIRLEREREEMEQLLEDAEFAEQRRASNAAGLGLAQSPLTASSRPLMAPLR